MESDEVLDRLDRIAAILELAFEQPIAAARQRIRADPVAASILDLSEEWISAGELKKQVSKATGQSERTVSRRLSSLVSQAFVKFEGHAGGVRYKASGLV